MDITHNGIDPPDVTPTGGPSTTKLHLKDGTGISWAVTKGSGQVDATPSIVSSVLPGAEIGYDQITASVNVTGTTLGTATTIIAGSAHTFDGSPVIAEFFAPFLLLQSVAQSSFNVELFEGGTGIAALCRAESPASVTSWIPVTGKYRFTPSAGSHTYSIKAYVASTTGIPSVQCGAAGSDVNAPAYLRFTKV